MDEKIINEVVTDTINLIRSNVIPVSSETDSLDFEKFALKLEELVKLSKDKEKFIQVLEAVNYWVGDSCAWTDEFLEVYNLFKKKIKKELINNA